MIYGFILYKLNDITVPIIQTIKNSNLAHNILNLFIIEGANSLLPIIALPFLYRMLGGEMYGVVASAYSFFLFTNVVIDFGFNLSATREVSLSYNNASNLNIIVSKTLISKALITVVTLVIGAIIIENIPNFKPYHHIFYLMMGIPIGTCFFPVWFFQGIEKMGYMTLTTTLSKLLSFVPMFFIVRGPEDVSWVSLFYSLGYVSSSVICLFILRYKFNVKYIKTSFADIKNALLSSAPFFLSRASATLYGVSNTVLLGIFCGPLIAGYYDISQKIISAFTALVSPIVTALYPFMIKNRNIIVFKKILITGIVIGIVCYLVFLILAPWLLEFFFAESNPITITTFRLLSICVLFVIPSYLLGYPFLAALGHTHYTNNTVIIAGFMYAVTILLVYFLGTFSIYFAACLYVSCELLVFIFRIIGVNKYKSFKL